MGALAVPLPCRLGSLIGYAGEGRRGRDPSSQKGLGGALRESGYLATGRWPGGYPAQRAGEAARPQPTHPGLWRGAAPGPQALPGAPGSRLGPGSRKTVSAVGVLEQASTLLPDRRRGPAPHSHPVFVPGAGGHCVRAGNGGPGNPLPPPPRPGPLGNSKNTSGVSGGSPAFSLPERPGDGLSEVRTIRSLIKSAAMLGKGLDSEKQNGASGQTETRLRFQNPLYTFYKKRHFHPFLIITNSLNEGWIQHSSDQK